MLPPTITSTITLMFQSHFSFQVQVFVAIFYLFIIIIIYSLRVFPIRFSWWFLSWWLLSENKSPQVSRILLSILGVLSNAVIWIVSTRPPSSKSSGPFNNTLVIAPKAQITIGTIVTFMLHSFFNSLARSRYLFFFSHSFSFILWSAGTAKSTILHYYYYYYYYYCKYYIPILTEGFSEETEWQHVSLGL